MRIPKKVPMKARKVAWILTVVIFLNNPYKIEGLDLFFTDFLRCFNYENPVFITAYEFDQDLGNIQRISTATLIRYATDKDEQQVAQYLKRLHLLGDLTMVVFIDDGHHYLLDLLVNDMQLFHKGVTGLISGLDANAGLNLTLRLDTSLYFYTSNRNSISLEEMYKVNGIVKTKIVGTWTSNTGLVVPTTNVWERRSSLEGMTLRTAVISTPKLHELHNETLNKSVIMLGSGYFLEPLNILAQKLNFTLLLMPSIDGQWGAVDDRGKWNGLIGMLVNDQTDIAVVLTVTEERQMVVDFSNVIHESSITIRSNPNKR